MEWTWTPTSTAAVAVILAFLMITTIISSILLMRGLIRAGQSPAPSMLVVSVSLLSLTALIGGLIFNSDSALALAGAGIGAIAGAVSSVFTMQRGGNCDDPPVDPEPPPADEGVDSAST